MFIHPFFGRLDLKGWVGLGKLGFALATATAVAGANQLALADRKGFVFIYNPLMVPTTAQGIPLCLVFALLLSGTF